MLRPPAPSTSGPPHKFCLRCVALARPIWYARSVFCLFTAILIECQILYIYTYWPAGRWLRAQEFYFKTKLAQEACVLKTYR